jgi:hypothetical protein
MVEEGEEFMQGKVVLGRWQKEKKRKKRAKFGKFNPRHGKWGANCTVFCIVVST